MTSFICLGNPICDISVKGNQAFLDKYNLPGNVQILAEEKHATLVEEMLTLFNDNGVSYTPGGAGQNTSRLLSVLWKEQPHSVAYMGCVGKDKFAQQLEDKCKETGVKAIYQYHDSKPTGQCAAICTDDPTNSDLKRRALVAFLNAAECFTIDHIDKPDNWAIIEKANCAYIAGFFLTSCFPAATKIASHFSSAKKPFTLNLSAGFICSVFKQLVIDIMPHVDILFANEDEAALWGENAGFKGDLSAIALQTANMPKVNQDRPRMVIFTQQAEPVIIAHGSPAKVDLFPVPQMPHGSIIDSNGAGDAFCAGFLSKYFLNADLKEALKCANFTAQHVLKRHGCTLDDTFAYVE